MHVKYRWKESWIASTAASYHYCVTSYKHVRERKRCSELGYMSFVLSSHLLQNPQPPSLSSVPFAPSILLKPLHASSAVLLVDVPVALLLHPVLEDHGDAKNQDEIDTNDTERGGEDLVKVFVGERGEGTNTSALLSCNEGVGADIVLDKGGCGSIDVSAAIELTCISCLQSRTYESVHIL